MPYASREQRRQYQREWVAKRRQDFFADKRCARCGSTENLELDHLDPEQKVSHRIWSWSAARRESEISKCQVLCASCHKRKTFDDVGYTAHGTHYRYSTKGCRCGVCRAGHNAMQAKWRAGKSEPPGTRTQNPPIKSRMPLSN